ncbi:N-acyl homoserine lactonase family protein [Rhizobium tubonense]|uniref:N-acyl homoserine lactonase family protein n=1 Tax=Rhizobium tubonense TaxID=484088 RepID=UPI001FCF0278|nr:N-acyl homoserine lactonase family protein [Rhizobium tubonense]
MNRFCAWAVVAALANPSISTAASSDPPALTGSGVADRLYRLDCGHSVANDESVWTPGENVGKSIEFSSTCYLIKHGRDVIMWDTGVPEATVNDPKGWSTLPSLIVYHVERTLTSQLVEIGLAPGDVTYVILSHSHGDHIGNVKLFPDSEVILQKAEFDWINSGPQADPKLNALTALARELLGHPKKLRLINGDLDLYGDGSVDLISTPGHTPGSQSLMVHLAKSGYIILSGDVVHSKGNFERRTVPSLNTDRAQSLASMQRIRSIMQTRHAQMFINHDKAQTDQLKLIPDFYD